MKQKFFPLVLLVCLLSLSSMKVAAQSNTTAEKGHWQLVSNIHEKKMVTVQFYSANEELMYEETLKTRLNVSRKKVRRQLDEALTKVNQAWAITHMKPSFKDLITRSK